MKIKLAVLLFALFACASPAHASMFQGEALDTMADILAWVVLIFAPIIGIAVFLLVHILPEKIAEKKQHPQAKAIQTLCILSLFFGGLLWPLAWLWAYSKPVMYKIAYGTDKLEHDSDTEKKVPTQEAEQELDRLRQLVSALETQLREKPVNGKGSA
ncbi:MAG: DUF3302 domain-containing protein [Arenimonas sp.]|nr:DUF3302 domain-containing protein [Arenimonas sp.]